MEKITHGIAFGTLIEPRDDMRVLNVLVEEVQGLLPVSGSRAELGLVDIEVGE